MTASEYNPFSNSYDKLMENIGKLEKDVYNMEFDVTNVKGLSLLLSVLEASKKLLRTKNPEVSEDQADKILSPKQVLEQKRQLREQRRKEKEEQQALTKEEKKAISDAEKKKKKDEREKRRQRRIAREQAVIDSYKKMYKEKVKALKKEVINILKSIKEALFALWRDFVDITKRLINCIIQTASAIPGVIIMIAAPPWNIPGAISYTITVIELYLSVIKAIKDILPWFRPLNYLPLVTDKKNLKIIAIIFNPIIVALRAYIWPIKKIMELIGNMLKKLSNYLTSNKENIFRKATRKLKKFGHLYKKYWIHPKTGQIFFNDTGIIPTQKLLRGDDYYPAEGTRKYPCYTFDEEDVDEIQSLLDTFIVGFEDTPSNRVVDYRQVPTETAVEIATAVGVSLNSPSINTFGDNFNFMNFDLGALADELNNIPLPEVFNSEDFTEQDIEDRFIYDIELPDGTIIQNISEEGIEFYKQNYILKYMNTFTQSYELALSLI